MACMLSALLWTLVLAPAAHADTEVPPSLTDPAASGPGTTAAGHTVTLTRGTYSDDLPGLSTATDSWFDCPSASPPVTAVGSLPDGCTPITPTTPTTYVVTSADEGSYITVFETDVAASTVLDQTNQAMSNPLEVLPPPPPAPVNEIPPSIAGATTSGSTVTAVTGNWTGSGNSYSYSWQLCPSSSGAGCVPRGAGPTLQLTGGDVGGYLLLTQMATASSAGGQASASANSPLFGPITTPTPTFPAPTETTFQITPSGVVAGQPATLIATVTSATSQAPPLGVVTFEQAGTAITGCASVTTHPVGASATVSCQAAFAGSASTLSAVFTPAPGSQVTGSDSTAVGFVLGRAATTAMMILPSRVTVGERLSVTAKVAPQAGTTGVSPTGDVVFLDGKKAIKGCSSTLVKGAAHCALTYRALGTHSISAVYLGDGNFSGSSTNAHTLTVGVAKPTGYVSSLMTWTFRFKPQYTRVTTLAVTGVQPGLTISVDCSGGGCPKHRYVDTVTRAACGKRDVCKDVNLARRFTGRKLGVGAALTVRLTHPGWLGKYYSFVVRHGRKPKIDTACLAVGRAKPGAGCTPP